MSRCIDSLTAVCGVGWRGTRKLGRGMGALSSKKRGSYDGT